MSKDAKSGYYDVGGIEVIEVIKAKLTREKFIGYLLGNAIKYQLRMMHKTPNSVHRDAEKAANYSVWLRDELNVQPEPRTPAPSADAEIIKCEEIIMCDVCDKEITDYENDLFHQSGTLRGELNTHIHVCAMCHNPALMQVDFDKLLRKGV